MKKIFLNFVGFFLMACISGQSVLAGVANGKLVLEVSIRPGQDYADIKLEPHDYTEVPSCVEDAGAYDRNKYTRFRVHNLSTNILSRQLYATALAARLSNKRVSINGTNDCPSGGVETITILTVDP